MSTATSHRCVNCNLPYKIDDLYCLQCGYILPHALDTNDQTRNFGSQQNRNVDLQWGTGYFHHRAKLYLHLAGTDIVIPIPLQARSVVIGRSSEAGNVDIDLTRFEALTLGVSRRHVRLDRHQDYLQVTDLESANGTFLNRDRLRPGVPQMLRNRAVLQLGRMIWRIQFA